MFNGDNEIILNFLYKGQEIKMQSKRTEYMRDILNRYVIKLNKNLSDVYFLYNGNLINEELQLKDINNQDNSISILVYDNKQTSIYQNKKNQSNDIICPKCRRNCIININNYKINLNKCDFGHETNNIFLSEFNYTQKIDESLIVCNICKKTKKETYNNEFYKCCICKVNLCPICKSNHNKKHILIDYEMRDFLCNTHGERYTSYCKQCSKNLCYTCELEHNNFHNFIYHREIINNNNNLNELRIKIDNVKKEVVNIKNILNQIINNLEIYYTISNNIIIRSEIKNKNYQILMNINNINEYNQNIIKDIQYIINETKIDKKFSYLLNIYKRMKEKEEDIIIPFNIGINNNQLNLKNLDIGIIPDNKKIINRSISLNEQNKFKAKGDLTKNMLMKKPKHNIYKYNVIFDGEKKVTLVYDYHTTINQMLKNYLVKIGGSNENYTFIYNAIKLNFEDNSPIELIFVNNQIPNVYVV